jgi:hypothetical protein
MRPPIPRVRDPRGGAHQLGRERLDQAVLAANADIAASGSRAEPRARL